MTRIRFGEARLSQRGHASVSLEGNVNENLYLARYYRYTSLNIEMVEIREYP